MIVLAAGLAVLGTGLEAPPNSEWAIATINAMITATPPTWIRVIRGSSSIASTPETLGLVPLGSRASAAYESCRMCSLLDPIGT
jgi:hypothetical protein